MKKYALLIALGSVILILSINLAGWSFYHLLQNNVSEFIENTFGITDENTQLIMITVIFLGLALVTATITGISIGKVINDFLK